MTKEVGERLVEIEVTNSFLRQSVEEIKQSVKQMEMNVQLFLTTSDKLYLSKQSAKEQYANSKEFAIVKRLVFSFVGLILASVVGSLIALVTITGRDEANGKDLYSDTIDNIYNTGDMNNDSL